MRGTGRAAGSGCVGVGGCRNESGGGGDDCDLSIYCKSMAYSGIVGINTHVGYCRKSTTGEERGKEKKEKVRWESERVVVLVMFYPSAAIPQLDPPLSKSILTLDIMPLFKKRTRDSGKGGR